VERKSRGDKRSEVVDVWTVNVERDALEWKRWRRAVSKSLCVRLAYDPADTITL